MPDGSVAMGFKCEFKTRVACGSRGQGQDFNPPDSYASVVKGYLRVQRGVQTTSKLGAALCGLSCGITVNAEHTSFCGPSLQHTTPRHNSPFQPASHPVLPHKPHPNNGSRQTPRELGKPAALQAGIPATRLCRRAPRVLPLRPGRVLTEPRPAPVLKVLPLPRLSGPPW